MKCRPPAVNIITGNLNSHISQRFLCDFPLKALHVVPSRKQLVSIHLISLFNFWPGQRVSGATINHIILRV